MQLRPHVVWASWLAKRHAERCPHLLILAQPAGWGGRAYLPTGQSAQEPEKAMGPCKCPLNKYS